LRSSFAGSTESAVAADVRELLKQWKDENTEGDALLDALRDLFTIATLKKCPPVVVHDIRLFLHDNGVNVDMRTGYPSYYAVRRMLAVPAVELAADPGPGIVSALANIQLSGHDATAFTASARLPDPPTVSNPAVAMPSWMSSKAGVLDRAAAIVVPSVLNAD
jgi:hypothetical protein